MITNTELAAWNEKCWGETRCLFDTRHYSKHELRLKTGGFCSFHYHRNRTNVFTVLEGHVRVVLSYGWNLHSYDLVPNDQLHVRACVPHQFQVIKDGAMIEEYMPDPGPVNDLDIIRLTAGGTIQPNPLIDRFPVIWIDAYSYWTNGGEKRYI